LGAAAGLGPLEKVETNGFWADRFELCHTQMLPSMGRLMEGTNYSQYFRNFEIAAGRAEGHYRGAPFNDGDFYKLVEGACAAYYNYGRFLSAEELAGAGKTSG